MSGNDISWSASGETFNLRVAAVISHDRKILLCTVGGLGYWFLPGGRVRFGESARLTLSRELAEELGHKFPAGRLALVVENIYRDSSLQHEVGFYYRLAWPPGLADSDATAAIAQARWRVVDTSTADKNGEYPSQHPTVLLERAVRAVDQHREELEDRLAEAWCALVPTAA